MIKYGVFPPLSDEILSNPEFNRQIKIPNNPLKIVKKMSASLEKPLREYTNENICGMIWLTCWIAMYHRHDKLERVHLAELLNNTGINILYHIMVNICHEFIAKMKLNTKHKMIVKEYISEALCLLKDDPKTQYMHLNYFYHFCKAYGDFKVTWKD